MQEYTVPGKLGVALARIFSRQVYNEFLSKKWQWQQYWTNYMVYIDGYYI